MCATLQLKSLRQQVGVVIQETILFNTTIRENIRYGKLDATDAEVEDAARAANIAHVIEALPRGYDTKIGEDGIKLSGGEKQRIAIARAILSDPKILILDEATSSLDSETEALIQEALDRLLEGRTSFVVAHRLSTIVKADKIVVMEKGEIMEAGSHAELLGKRWNVRRALSSAVPCGTRRSRRLDSANCRLKGVINHAIPFSRNRPLS